MAYKNNLHPLVLLFLSIILIFGCELSIANHASQKNKEPDALSMYNHIWHRMRQNFHLTHPHEHRRVDEFINKFSKQPYHILQVSAYAAPYVHHIIEELERRKMPGELALLPMIESAYKPFETSNKGAAGIWQLGPATAARYGIKQDKWYEGRRDVRDSTKAALDYLQFLHDNFNRDWLLAIAAYNCGEGCVGRAIRANKRKNMPIDFWNLKLPEQTRDFVPKFLALSHIMNNPRTYGVKLTPVANQPYFVAVDTGSQMDLHMAANLAEVDLHELRRLNAGYIKQTTHPEGPHQILLPSSQAKTFRVNLAKLSTKGNQSQQLVQNTQYQIKPGDTLGKIAAKFNISLSALRTANQLKSNNIIAGRTLVIPGQPVTKTAQLETRIKKT